MSGFMRFITDPQNHLKLVCVSRRIADRPLSGWGMARRETAASMIVSAPATKGSRWRPTASSSKTHRPFQR